MVRNLIFLLVFMFVGCEMNSQQIIKPEKFNFDEIKFNSVSKNLFFGSYEDNYEIDNMKKIISYWYDNRIKTDGFDGTLDVNVKEINTTKVKEEEYFKFSINITFEFIEKGENPSRSKTYTIKASEFGEIKGNFSIKDQENLTLNIMHQSLNSVSKKLLELN